MFINVWFVTKKADCSFHCMFRSTKIPPALVQLLMFPFHSAKIIYHPYEFFSACALMCLISCAHTTEETSSFPFPLVRVPVSACGTSGFAILFEAEAVVCTKCWKPKAWTLICNATQHEHYTLTDVRESHSRYYFLQSYYFGKEGVTGELRFVMHSPLLSSFIVNDAMH